MKIDNFQLRKYIFTRRKPLFCVAVFTCENLCITSWSCILYIFTLASVQEISTRNLTRHSICSPGKDATLALFYNNATLNKKPFVLCPAFYLIFRKGLKGKFVN